MKANTYITSLHQLLLLLPLHAGGERKLFAAASRASAPPQPTHHNIYSRQVTNAAPLVPVSALHQGDKPREPCQHTQAGGQGRVFVRTAAAA